EPANHIVVDRDLLLAATELAECGPLVEKRPGQPCTPVTAAGTFESLCDLRKDCQRAGRIVEVKLSHTERIFAIGPLNVRVGSGHSLFCTKQSSGVIPAIDRLGSQQTSGLGNPKIEARRRNWLPVDRRRRRGRRYCSRDYRSSRAMVVPQPF